MQGNEGPRRPKCVEMKARKAKMQGLNVPQEEMLLNRDQVRKGFHVQGANLNVPQEEMPLNMQKFKPRAVPAKTLGFRVLTFDRQCDGVM